MSGSHHIYIEREFPLLIWWQYILASTEGNYKRCGHLAVEASSWAFLFFFFSHFYVWFFWTTTPSRVGLALLRSQNAQAVNNTNKIMSFTYICTKSIAATDRNCQKFIFDETNKIIKSIDGYFFESITLKHFYFSCCCNVLT